MASSILEALDIIATQITPVGKELIPIELALGRISTQEYIASFDLPRFDNSAMDGYAVKVADAQSQVSCTEVIFAGDNPTMTLQEHTAIKIMTGAPIPKGCEAIVPIEQVSLKGRDISLPKDIKLHGFIRIAGEDIKKGSVFLRKGSRINAYTIASLASQGVSHIAVYRQIKVAVFATGDELRPHYESIEPHQLYNSNSPMFMARSKELGADVRLIQTSADSIEALQSCIHTVLDADIIITSGGVSVGDKDFTKEAFTNLGMEVLIDKIDIKPGRPTIIGKIAHTIVINLAGNPLASMINYELFVRAVLRKMSGIHSYHHGVIETKMAEDFCVRGGKHAVVLGSFDGQAFRALASQMPGMVSPMDKAEGMVLITPETSILKKGTGGQNVAYIMGTTKRRIRSVI
ncbi:MAG: molybdopterin molybdotransferase MoeA [Sulfurovum sp.]|nr:molybdopterin molybdotransferase MoeA [Sulfurovum sp.]